MIRVLHIADAHLGANPFGTRSGDFFRSWRWMMGVAGTELREGDVVIMAGDIFDYPFLLPREVEAFREAMGYFVNRLRLRVVLIEGNHDSSGKKEVAAKGTEIRRGEWPTHFRDEFDPEEIYIEQTDPQTGLPRVYFVEDLNSDELHAITICPINYRPKLEIRDLVSRLPRDYATILVMHQSMEGAVPRIGDPDLMPGGVEGKAKYIALGDLHVRWSNGVMEADDARTPQTFMAYPGPLEWSRTSEAGTPGVAIIDFEEGRPQRFQRLSNPVSRAYVQIETAPGATVDAVRPFQDAGFRFVDGTEGVVKLGQGNLIWAEVEKDDGKSMYLEVKYPHYTDASAKDFAGEVFNEILRHFRSDSYLGAVTKLPSVDRNFTFSGEAQTSSSGEVTMVDAIRAMHDERNPQVTDVALAIWERPEELNQILSNAQKTDSEELRPTPGGT